MLWGIVSLRVAFEGYSLQEYFQRVVKQNNRLPVKKTWPIIIQTIIQEGWDEDPQKRPSMKRVATLIRSDLEDMTSDATVINRTNHMMNKSSRSFHNTFGLNGSGHLMPDSYKHSNGGSHHGLPESAFTANNVGRKKS